MTLDQRYEVWRQKPESIEVFRGVLRRARQSAGLGVKFGVKFFAELVRWERAQLGDRTEKYKVNNSYVSRLAREIAKVDPSLAPFFSTRKLAIEREKKVDPRWLKQVNAPRRIPTRKLAA